MQYGFYQAMSPLECLAARGLLSLSRQQLATISGVSVRTISSFEEPSEGRRITSANLSALEEALTRLGVIFSGNGVGWAPAFSRNQIKAIQFRSVLNGPGMPSLKDVIQASDCSMVELDQLADLLIFEGLNGLPLLTPLGHRIAQLLGAFKEREGGGPYSVGKYLITPDGMQIYHNPTGTALRVSKDGSLDILGTINGNLADRELLLAGAEAALRNYRSRHPAIVGYFSAR